MSKAMEDGKSVRPTKPFRYSTSQTESDAQPFRQSDNLPVPLPTNIVDRKKSIIDESSLVKNKFIERLDLLSDEFEYKPKGTDPGKILIFYHEEYNDKNTKRRNGGRRDVNEIITCFQRLGFNITGNNIYKDSTIDQINTILDEVSKEDFSNTNCLIVFFLSHGGDGDELSAFDGTLKTTDIWKTFEQCETLTGTPKMFVFQACKGDETALIKAKTIDETDFRRKVVSETHFSTGEIGPDTLLIYSTLEGDRAFRDTKTGSWFIQELCKNFSSYARRDDVLSLLTRTAKCVSTSYSNVTGLAIVEKQMPVFVSTLRRKFYLNRNKDRHFLLKILNSKDETLKELKLINDIVHDINSTLVSPLKAESK